MHRIFCLMSACIALTAGEASIRASGVIGNTGEQGAALVRSATDTSYRGHGHATGCGVALDRLGTLWVRMDDAFITRLSLDGRQLGRFASPRSSNGFDTLAALGDRILLLADGELATLPIDAAAGSACKPTGVKLRALAHNPVKERLAAVTSEGGIVWISADGSASAEVARLPDAWLVEADGAGALYVGTRASPQQEGWMHKLVGGTEVTGGGWPKAWVVSCPGIAMVPNVLAWADGVFFQGGSGHLSAFDANLDPAPGTVLGMQGNYVIGIGADWRPELSCARGLVRVRPGAYVVAGSGGQPFLAGWPDQTRSMHLAGWITARADCPALSLDADGTVFVDHLMYAWTATPDAFPVALPGAGIASAIVRAGPRLLIRQDRWAHGGGSWALPMYSGSQMQDGDWIGEDKLEKAWWERANADQQRIFPAVAYPEGGGLTYLALADAGGARAVLLHANGRYRATGGTVAFATAQPGKQLTSLAMRDDQTLLAAIDGQVVEMSRSGSDWKEARRWNSWGAAPAERFGASITIACDAGRLLVADRDRNRVLWFPAAGGRPKAIFGRTDTVGTDLQSLDAPGLIAVCGGRAVVHDRGNQRLVKLELGE